MPSVSVAPVAGPWTGGLPFESCILASHISLARKAEIDHHVRAAVRVGCTKEEILEVFILMSAYAGFSAMHAGLEAARPAFEDLGLIPKTETSA